MILTEERIARSIAARSQILKKFRVDGGICSFHIEESVFAHDGGYSQPELEQDIDGFLADVDRELSPFGVAAERPLVKMRVEDDLLVFMYDRDVPKPDDATLERIRMSEWIFEEE